MPKVKLSFFEVAMRLSAIFLAVSTVNSDAFALLGPVQPWMQATNGVIFPGDIGGPMPIGSGYRWNVPVVTYGFDQSFLNYFGSNGVAAVEKAVQILNELPPASQIVTTNYPLVSEQLNSAAGNQSLTDLKSATLSLLLGHMGLAAPTQYIYVLQEWNPILFGESELFVDVFEYPTIITNYIVTRNYDPQNLNITPYVNGILYSGQIYDNGIENIITPFPVDPLSPPYAAVADFAQYLYNSPGNFYTGLTYDDVSGLAYLLSTNTVNYETLIPGVAGAGTNSSSFVDGAWRPGVDKITFVPQPVDPQSGAFLPATNYFTDSYITNGVLIQQQMMRVVSQPDFLFSAGDATLGNDVPFYTHTGTTNWLNNVMANGNTNGAGPGVITPPIQIVFNKLGRLLASSAYSSEDQVLDYTHEWGSFDGSTNTPVTYPIPQAGTNQSTLRMWLGGNSEPSFVWKPGGLSGKEFALQTSTNLMTWTTLFSITNDGSSSAYYNDHPASSSRFYRLIPQ